LLVVLVIVAVLIALLYPASQEAVRSSHAAKCSSNLRQLGMGVNGYHADHNMFPSGGWMNTGIDWVYEIFPYVGNNKDVFFCPDIGTQGPGGAWGWDNFPAPYQKSIYSMCYAYNACLNSDGEAGVTAGPRNMQSAHSLSKLPIIVEIVWENNFYGYAGCFPAAPTPTNGGSFACRHNNMGNVLWGDGSVSAWTAASLYALTGSGSHIASFCVGNY
jgi:prepilin-type processing-associated H-X9-DG protein